MIERIHVNERSSKIVKHNGVVYLTGRLDRQRHYVSQSWKSVR